MFEAVSAVVALAPLITKQLFENVKKAEDQKVDYARKIETASGDELFKYLLLIDVSALDSYTNQTRLQAEPSFGLSKLVAILGFTLLGAAVVLGIISQVFLRQGLQIAYLPATSGVITEFIAGVFFYLYNATLRQINLFHSELQMSRRIAVGLLLNASVEDPSSRDKAKLELAQLLIGASIQEDAGRNGTESRAPASQLATRRTSAAGVTKEKGG